MKHLVVTSYLFFTCTLAFGQGNPFLNTSDGTLHGYIRDMSMNDQQRFNDQLQQRLGVSQDQRDVSRLLGNGGYNPLNTSDGTLHGQIRDMSMNDQQRFNDHIQRIMGASQDQRDVNRVLGNGGHNPLSTSDGTISGYIRDMSMTDQQRFNERLYTALSQAEISRLVNNFEDNSFIYDDNKSLNEYVKSMSEAEQIKFNAFLYESLGTTLNESELKSLFQKVSINISNPKINLNGNDPEPSWEGGSTGNDPEPSWEGGSTGNDPEPTF
jgi:uncharacterized protein YeeX (DUF496 family)